MHVYGRAHEEWALRVGLRRARRGRGTLLVLHGQRGCGKTALVLRAADMAAEGGADVIAGPAARHRKLLLAAALAGGAGVFRTYPGSGTPPVDGRGHGLLDEVLAGTLAGRPRGTGGGAGNAASPGNPGTLAARRAGDPAGAPAGAPRTRPDGGSRPVLVALDDVDWDDPDIRGALPVLATACLRRPVTWLLAGAGRPRLPEPLRDGGAVDLGLGPLPRHDALRLAADRLGGVPDAAIRRLIDACGGHPGLLTAVLEALAAEGGHVVRDGMAVRAAGAFPPRTVALLLRADPRLSAGARSLLAGLAAGHRPSRTADLSRLPERRAVAALAAVRDAAEAGVLVVDGEVLRFRHHLLREAALLLARAEAPDGTKGAPDAGAYDPAAGAATDDPAPREDPGLSATEGGIARLVAAGLTNGQIASRVNLSPHTVKFHLRKIFRKLGVSSRTELVGAHQHLFGSGGTPPAASTPREGRAARAG